MLYSDEFKEFLLSKNDTYAVLSLNHGLREVNTAMKTLKQEIANNLPDLFMCGDKEQITKNLEFGKEIDELIEIINEMIILKKNENEDSVENKNIETTTIIQQLDKEESNKLIHEKEIEQTITTENKINLKSDSEIKYIDLIPTHNKLNKCIFCDETLQDHTLTYLRYTDSSKTNSLKKCLTFIKECPKCGKQFITEGTLKTIDKDTTNIRLISPPQNRIKTSDGCMDCGEPIWNNSQYCWYHYKYHNYESK